ncbi:hypothetical protein [Embleya sp. NPDC001921]
MFGSIRKRTVGTLLAVLGTVITLVTAPASSAQVFCNGGSGALYDVTATLTSEFTLVDPDGNEWATAGSATGPGFFASPTCNATHPLPQGPACS